MTTYKACFKGRKAGAIGAFSYFNVEVEADNTSEAERKLYDTHEHITGLLWLWQGKQTVCSHKPEDVARCGEVYVSTYNGHSWKQTNCNRDEVSKVKAEHLADSDFMNRYNVNL